MNVKWLREQFERLSDEEKQAIGRDVAELQEELEDIMHHVPQRRSVLPGTPVAIRASRSDIASCANTLASTTTAPT